jgi:pimeloyl-ACP methyl ester carboxylesterase
MTLRISRRAIALSGGDASVLEFARAGYRARVNKPALHFAHANGFNAQTYAQLLSPLADTLTVFASDLRGHGHTTLPADPKHFRSWSIYRDDLIALLERLPGAPFILGGHSMGATASFGVAVKRPDLVQALVLVEPVLLPPGVRLVARALKALGLYDRALPMAQQAQRRRAHWPDVETALGAYRGRGAFKTWPEAVLRDYLEGGLIDKSGDGQLTLACSPNWEAANYRAGPPSALRWLSRLRCPVFLLTGGSKSTCPAPVAMALQLRVKQLKWQYFPEATHFLPMEKPDAVRAAILTACE